MGFSALPEEARFIVYSGIRNRYSPQGSKLLLDRVNADLLVVTAHTLETNLTVNEREQRVIRASAYVLTRMDVRAALLNKNVACEDVLTICTLDTESFGFGITAVLRGAHTFFMSKQLDIDLKHFVAFLSFYCQTSA